MRSRLELNVPWITETQVDSDLTMSPGGLNRLVFDDGIELAVEVVSPASADSADGLLALTKDASRPGVVVLVAGNVPAEWRARLRATGTSWLDHDGVLELHWPRVDVSADRTNRVLGPRSRRRQPMPLQKRRGAVAQALAIAEHERRTPVTIGVLAEEAGCDQSTASRTVDVLSRRGLVEIDRIGTRTEVSVPNLFEYLEILQERTSWARLATLPAYLWGQTARSRAVKLSEAAGHANLDLVVTGTVAAEFHGTIATSEAAHVQCRLQCLPDELAYLATRLKLELVPPEEANVLLAADRWGVGRVGAARPGAIPRLAHPIRIWCDMHVGRRGHELAALYKAEQLRG